MNETDKLHILHAARIISNYAESLYDCNTFEGEWDDRESEIEYQEHCRIVKEIRRIAGWD